MFDGLLPGVDGCDPPDVGPLAEAAGVVAPDAASALAEFGLFEFVLPEAELVPAPFCDTVVPETGMHVRVGVVGVPFC